MEFPYADDRQGADFVGDYTSIEKHTTVVINNKGNLLVQRKMDDFSYFVTVTSDSKIKYEQAGSAKNPHKFLIIPANNLSNFTFTFSQDSKTGTGKPENVFNASARGWEKYWLSGAAIDFSECTDERAFELERRIVLSQYHMKVNNSGSLPPPELGLLKNNWYGKFHFEMLWWHGVHFALWNRWDELDEMLKVYQKFLPTSIERAKNKDTRVHAGPNRQGTSTVNGLS